jgi:hypothetical protein
MQSEDFQAQWTGLQDEGPLCEVIGAYIDGTEILVNDLAYFSDPDRAFSDK